MEAADCPVVANDGVLSLYTSSARQLWPDAICRARAFHARYIIPDCGRTRGRTRRLDLGLQHIRRRSERARNLRAAGVSFQRHRRDDGELRDEPMAISVASMFHVRAVVQRTTVRTLGLYGRSGPPAQSI